MHRAVVDKTCAKADVQFSFSAMLLRAVALLSLHLFFDAKLLVASKSISEFESQRFSRSQPLSFTSECADHSYATFATVISSGAPAHVTHRAADLLSSLCPSSGAAARCRSVVHLLSPSTLDPSPPLSPSAAAQQIIRSNTSSPSPTSTITSLILNALDILTALGTRNSRSRALLLVGVDGHSVVPSVVSSISAAKAEGVKVFAVVASEALTPWWESPYSVSGGVSTPVPSLPWLSSATSRLVSSPSSHHSFIAFSRTSSSASPSTPPTTSLPSSTIPPYSVSSSSHSTMISALSALSFFDPRSLSACVQPTSVYISSVGVVSVGSSSNVAAQIQRRGEYAVGVFSSLSVGRVGVYITLSPCREGGGVPEVVGRSGGGVGGIVRGGGMCVVKVSVVVGREVVVVQRSGWDGLRGGGGGGGVDVVVSGVGRPAEGPDGREAQQRHAVVLRSRVPASRRRGGVAPRDGPRRWRCGCATREVGETNDTIGGERVGTSICGMGGGGGNRSTLFDLNMSDPWRWPGGGGGGCDGVVWHGCLWGSDVCSNLSSSSTARPSSLTVVTSAHTSGLGGGLISEESSAPPTVGPSAAATPTGALRTVTAHASELLKTTITVGRGDDIVARIVVDATPAAAVSLSASLFVRGGVDWVDGGLIGAAEALDEHAGGTLRRGGGGGGGVAYGSGSSALHSAGWGGGGDAGGASGGSSDDAPPARCVGGVNVAAVGGASTQTEAACLSSFGSSGTEWGTRPTSAGHQWGAAPPSQPFARLPSDISSALISHRVQSEVAAVMAEAWVAVGGEVVAAGRDAHRSGGRVGGTDVDDHDDVAIGVLGRCGVGEPTRGSKLSHHVGGLSVIGGGGGVRGCVVAYGDAVSVAREALEEAGGAVDTGRWDMGNTARAGTADYARFVQSVQLANTLAVAVTCRRLFGRSRVADVCVHAAALGDTSVVEYLFSFMKSVCEAQCLFGSRIVSQNFPATHRVGEGSGEGGRWAGVGDGAVFGEVLGGWATPRWCGTYICSDSASVAEVLGGYSSPPSSSGQSQRTAPFPLVPPTMPPSVVTQVADVSLARPFDVSALPPSPLLSLVSEALRTHATPVREPDDVGSLTPPPSPTMLPLTHPHPLATPLHLIFNHSALSPSLPAVVESPDSAVGDAFDGSRWWIGAASAQHIANATSASTVAAYVPLAGDYVFRTTAINTQCRRVAVTARKVQRKCVASLPTPVPFAGVVKVNACPRTPRSFLPPNLLHTDRSSDSAVGGFVGEAAGGFAGPSRAFVSVSSASDVAGPCATLEAQHNIPWVSVGVSAFLLPDERGPLAPHLARVRMWWTVAEAPQLPVAALSASALRAARELQAALHPSSSTVNTTTLSLGDASAALVAVGVGQRHDVVPQSVLTESPASPPGLQVRSPSSTFAPSSTLLPPYAAFGGDEGAMLRYRDRPVVQFRAPYVGRWVLSAYTSDGCAVRVVNVTVDVGCATPTSSLVSSWYQYEGAPTADEDNDDRGGGDVAVGGDRPSLVARTTASAPQSLSFSTSVHFALPACDASALAGASLGVSVVPHSGSGFRGSPSPPSAEGTGGDATGIDMQVVNTSTVVVVSVEPTASVPSSLTHRRAATATEGLMIRNASTSGVISGHGGSAVALDGLYAGGLRANLRRYRLGDIAQQPFDATPILEGSVLRRSSDAALSGLSSESGRVSVWKRLAWRGVACVTPSSGDGTERTGGLAGVRCFVGGYPSVPSGANSARFSPASSSVPSFSSQLLSGEVGVAQGMDARDAKLLAEGGADAAHSSGLSLGWGPVMVGGRVVPRVSRTVATTSFITTIRTMTSPAPSCRVEGLTVSDSSSGASAHTVNPSAGGGEAPSSAPSVFRIKVAGQLSSVPRRVSFVAPSGAVEVACRGAGLGDPTSTPPPSPTPFSTPLPISPTRTPLSAITHSEDEGCESGLVSFFSPSVVLAPSPYPFAAQVSASPLSCEDLLAYPHGVRWASSTSIPAAETPVTATVTPMKLSAAGDTVSVTNVRWGGVHASSSSLPSSLSAFSDDLFFSPSVTSNASGLPVLLRQHTASPLVAFMYRGLSRADGVDGDSIASWPNATQRGQWAVADPSESDGDVLRSSGVSFMCPANKDGVLFTNGGVRGVCRGESLRVGAAEVLRIEEGAFEVAYSAVLNVSKVGVESTAGERSEGTADGNGAAPEGSFAGRVGGHRVGAVWLEAATVPLSMYTQGWRGVPLRANLVWERVGGSLRTFLEDRLERFHTVHPSFGVEQGSNTSTYVLSVGVDSVLLHGPVVVRVVASLVDAWSATVRVCDIAAVAVTPPRSLSTDPCATAAGHAVDVNVDDAFANTYTTTASIVPHCPSPSPSPHLPATSVVVGFNYTQRSWARLPAIFNSPGTRSLSSDVQVSGSGRPTGGAVLRPEANDGLVVFRVKSTRSSAANVFENRLEVVSARGQLDVFEDFSDSVYDVYTTTDDGRTGVCAVTECEKIDASSILSQRVEVVPSTASAWVVKALRPTRWTGGWDGTVLPVPLEMVGPLAPPPPLPPHLHTDSYCGSDCTPTARGGFVSDAVRQRYLLIPLCERNVATRYSLISHRAVEEAGGVGVWRVRVALHFGGPLFEVGSAVVEMKSVPQNTSATPAITLWTSSTPLLRTSPWVEVDVNVTTPLFEAPTVELRVSEPSPRARSLHTSSSTLCGAGGGGDVVSALYASHSYIAVANVRVTALAQGALSSVPVSLGAPLGNVLRVDGEGVVGVDVSHHPLSPCGSSSSSFTLTAKCMYDILPQSFRLLVGAVPRSSPALPTEVHQLLSVFPNGTSAFSDVSLLSPDGTSGGGDVTFGVESTTSSGAAVASLRVHPAATPYFILDVWGGFEAISGTTLSAVAHLQLVRATGRDLDVFRPTQRRFTYPFVRPSDVALHVTGAPPLGALSTTDPFERYGPALSRPPPYDLNLSHPNSSATAYPSGVAAALALSAPIAGVWEVVVTVSDGCASRNFSARFNWACEGVDFDGGLVFVTGGERGVEPGHVEGGSLAGSRSVPERVIADDELVGVDSALRVYVPFTLVNTRVRATYSPASRQADPMDLSESIGFTYKLSTLGSPYGVEVVTGREYVVGRTHSAVVVLVPYGINITAVVHTPSRLAVEVSQRLGDGAGTCAVVDATVEADFRVCTAPPLTTAAYALTSTTKGGESGVKGRAFSLKEGLFAVGVTPPVLDIDVTSATFRFRVARYNRSAFSDQNSIYSQASMVEALRSSWASTCNAVERHRPASGDRDAALDGSTSTDDSLRWAEVSIDIRSLTMEDHASVTPTASTTPPPWISVTPSPSVSVITADGSDTAASLADDWVFFVGKVVAHGCRSVTLAEHPPYLSKQWQREFGLTRPVVVGAGAGSRSSGRVSGSESADNELSVKGLQRDALEVYLHTEWVPVEASSTPPRIRYVVVEDAVGVAVLVCGDIRTQAPSLFADHQVVMLNTTNTALHPPMWFVSQAVGRVMLIPPVPPPCPVLLSSSSSSVLRTRMEVLAQAASTLRSPFPTAAGDLSVYVHVGEDEFHCPQTVSVALSATCALRDASVALKGTLWRDLDVSSAHGALFGSNSAKVYAEPHARAAGGSVFSPVSLSVTATPQFPRTDPGVVATWWVVSAPAGSVYAPIYATFPVEAVVATHEQSIRTIQADGFGAGSGAGRIVGGAADVGEEDKQARLATLRYRYADTVNKTLLERYDELAVLVQLPSFCDHSVVGASGGNDTAGSVGNANDADSDGRHQGVAWSSSELPATCFIPDVPGIFTVAALVSCAGCTTRDTAITIDAQCSPLPRMVLQAASRCVSLDSEDGVSQGMPTGSLRGKTLVVLHTDGGGALVPSSHYMVRWSVTLQPHTSDSRDGVPADSTGVGLAVPCLIAPAYRLHNRSAVAVEVEFFCVGAFVVVAEVDDGCQVVGANVSIDAYCGPARSTVQAPETIVVVDESVVEDCAGGDVCQPGASVDGLVSLSAAAPVLHSSAASAGGNAESKRPVVEGACEGDVLWFWEVVGVALHADPVEAYYEGDTVDASAAAATLRRLPYPATVVDIASSDRVVIWSVAAFAIVCLFIFIGVVIALILQPREDLEQLRRRCRGGRRRKGASLKRASFASEGDGLEGGALLSHAFGTREGYAGRSRLGADAELSRRQSQSSSSALRSSNANEENDDDDDAAGGKRESTGREWGLRAADRASHPLVRLATQWEWVRISDYLHGVCDGAGAVVADRNHDIEHQSRAAALLGTRSGVRWGPYGLVDELGELVGDGDGHSPSYVLAADGDHIPCDAAAASLGAGGAQSTRSAPPTAPPPAGGVGRSEVADKHGGVKGGGPSSNTSRTGSRGSRSVREAHPYDLDPRTPLTPMSGVSSAPRALRECEHAPLPPLVADGGRTSPWAGSSVSDSQYPPWREAGDEDERLLSSGAPQRSVPGAGGVVGGPAYPQMHASNGFALAQWAALPAPPPTAPWSGGGGGEALALSSPQPVGGSYGVHGELSGSPLLRPPPMLAGEEGGEGVDRLRTVDAAHPFVPLAIPAAATQNARCVSLSSEGASGVDGHLRSPAPTHPSHSPAPSFDERCLNTPPHGSTEVDPSARRLSLTERALEQLRMGLGGLCPEVWAAAAGNPPPVSDPFSAWAGGVVAPSCPPTAGRRTSASPTLEASPLSDGGGAGVAGVGGPPPRAPLGFSPLPTGGALVGRSPRGHEGTQRRAMFHRSLAEGRRAGQAALLAAQRSGSGPGGPLVRDGEIAPARVVPFRPVSGRIAEREGGGGRPSTHPSLKRPGGAVRGGSAGAAVGGGDVGGAARSDGDGVRGRRRLEGDVVTSVGGDGDIKKGVRDSDVAGGGGGAEEVVVGDRAQRRRSSARDAAGSVEGDEDEGAGAGGGGRGRAPLPRSIVVHAVPLAHEAVAAGLPAQVYSSARKAAPPAVGQHVVTPHGDGPGGSQVAVVRSHAPHTMLDSDRGYGGSPDLGGPLPSPVLVIDPASDSLRGGAAALVAPSTRPTAAGSEALQVPPRGRTRPKTAKTRERVQRSGRPSHPSQVVLPASPLEGRSASGEVDGEVGKVKDGNTHPSSFAGQLSQATLESGGEGAGDGQVDEGGSAPLRSPMGVTDTVSGHGGEGAEDGGAGDGGDGDDGVDDGEDGEMDAMLTSLFEAPMRR